MKKAFFILLAAFLLAPLSPLPRAHAEGHYQGGFTNIRDFVSPPKKGFVVLGYDPFFWGGDIVDSGGKKVESFSGSGTLRLGPREAVEINAAVSADIDVDLFCYTFQPMFFYFTDWEILGAKYGAGLSTPYGYVYTRLSADITGDLVINGRRHSIGTSATRHIEREDSAAGFGDMMVRPVMLDWSSDNYDIVLAYGFYAPTGSYDKENLANVGLGYWSHEISFGGLGYLFDKATSFLFNATYEFNTKKTGADVYPGQNLILEYGLSQYFATWLAVGVSGASYFQVTDDYGKDALNVSGHQQYHSVGGELVLWFVPGKFDMVGRYFYQYYGESTLIGQGANVTLRLLF